MIIFKLKKYKIGFYLAILFFATTAASHASQKLVFFATDFPPYEMENPSDPNLPGFDVEVIIEAFRRVNIQAEINFLPWKRIILLAKKGEIAGVVSCARKKSRDNFILYSDPISYATHSFIVKADYEGKNLLTLQDAQELRNLVVSGYTTEKELRDAKVEFDESENDLLAIRRLLERPYDTFYSTRENIEYLSKANSFRDKIKIFDLRKLSYHLCFTKDWPDADKLVREFNHGLEEIRKDGAFQNIRNKYK